MSTLIKHRNINNSLIPKLNIPDTIYIKEAGLLIWDNKKIAEDEGLTERFKISVEIYNENLVNNLALNSLSNSDYQSYLRLIQDLKDKYIYIDNPSHSEDYTNFLAKVNQATNDKYGLTYYKRINPNEDRLVYRVVYHIADKSTNSLNIVIQLKSCIGHEYRLNPNGPIIVRFSDLEVEDYFDEINTNDIYNPSLTELDW